MKHRPIHHRRLRLCRPCRSTVLAAVGHLRRHRCCWSPALIVVFFALYYRGSRAPRGELPERIEPRDRDRLDGRDAVHVPVHFLVGGIGPALGADAAEGRARNPRRRQAMDVAHPASERRARDRRAARAGPHQCAAGDDVAGRDPRSLSAGAAAEAGYPARPLHLLWFNADKTGIFHLTCAEFCGTDHSVMAGTLVIVTPQDYARWTAAQPEGDDLAHQGAALFHSLGCSGCHTPGSTRPRARSARRLRPRRAAHRRPHRDRRRSLSARLHPAAGQGHASPAFRRSMPNFTGSVTRRQIVALIAYIKSLTRTRRRRPIGNAATGASQ